MATEDLSTYAETDPNTRITVTTTAVSGTNVPRNEKSYLTYDFGVAYFNSAFTHHFEVTVTNNNSGHVYPWGLVNSAAADIKYYSDVPNALFAVHVYSASGYMFVQENDGTTSYSSSNITISFATKYYCSVVYDPAGGGTYGTLTLNVYTNAARTTHATNSPQSLTLHAAASFRYLYAYSSYDDIGASYIDSFTFENFDLAPASGSAIAKTMSHLNKLNNA